MAGSINKVIIVGNVGKDPEIRTAQDGSKFANFSVATSESRKDKMTGERIEKTEWHRVVVFNEHFTEVIEKYVKKGSKLYLEGQLQTRKWADPQGMERYVTEIVIGKFRGELAMLDNKSSQEEFHTASSTGNTTESGGSSSAAPVIMDDIPF
jgi:single-strand DNA-binding protein